MPANTLEDRNTLLAKTARLTKQLYGPESDRMTGLQMRRLQAERVQLQQEYRDTLPQVTVGRCPFTSELVTDRMDLFGFDGPFWDSLFAESQPVGGGAHFLFYQGAVNFHGERPAQFEVGKNERIKLGPEVPFVLPELLSRKECRCTIASIQLFGGRCTAYFMAYFSRPRIPAMDLQANWLRDSFSYVDSQGQRTLKVGNAAWDFNLGHWLDKPEKIAWIAPGDSSFTLQSTGASNCPYVDLRGERQPQEIVGGGLRFAPLPDGQPVTADQLLD